MAGGYETEEEQIEAIKRWWHENGRAIIAGLVIAVLGVVGWQQWQSYERSQALAAANAYQGVLNALNQGDRGQAADRAATLRSDHPGSVQAVLAGLRVGGAYADAGEYADAADALGRVADGDGQDALRRMAALRLAKALDAQGDYDAALDQVQPVPDGPFAARYHELVGDVQASRGEHEAAGEAYRAAINADPRARRRGLIQLKLADLGIEPESAS